MEAMHEALTYSSMTVLGVQADHAVHLNHLFTLTAQILKSCLLSGELPRLLVQNQVVFKVWKCPVEMVGWLRNWLGHILNLQSEGE